MAHPKTELNDRLKQLGLPRAVYRTVRMGPDHQPLFKSEALIGDELYGEGTGKAKRDAEREASKAALARLSEGISDSQPKVAPIPSDAFEGPWPLVPNVLAAAIAVADRRVPQSETGDAAITQVRDLAVKLYTDMLLALGEVVEISESDEDDG